MKYHHYILAIFVLPILASCAGEVLSFKLATAGISAASLGFFSRPDVNLKEKNYAAADFMVGQMSGRVSQKQVILALPLEEVDHAGISSPLGSFIPEGVGLRFAELGYQVWLHKVAAEGNSGLYPRPPKGAKADLVLKGTYLRKNKHVDVFLRLIDLKSSQVVAQFDYALLLSREVREMSETQTRIFRIAQ